MADVEGKPDGRPSLGPVEAWLLDVRRLRAVNEAALAITSELSLERVLQKIVDETRGLVGARYAALGIVEADRRRLARFIPSGLSPEQVAAIGHWPRGLGLLGELLRNPRPVRVADIAKDPRSVGFPPGHPPMRGFLGVPVVSHGRVLGNFYVADKLDAAEFDQEDEGTLVLFAAHAAIAVENARLYTETDIRLREKIAEVERAERRARFLAELGGLLPSAPLGEDVAVDKIAQGLSDSLGDACAIDLVDSDLPSVVPSDRPSDRPGGLTRRYVYHSDPSRRRSAAALIAAAGSALSARVIIHRQTMLLPDAGALARWCQENGLPSVEQYRFSGLIAVPLGTRDRVYGVLTSLASQPMRFHEADLEFAAVVAGRLATALENVRLFRRWQQQSDLLETIVGHSPAAMAVVSVPDCTFELVNPAYVALHGGIEPVGRRVADVFPELVEQGLTETIKRVAETGQTFTTTDLGVLLRRGRAEPEQTYWSFSYVPLRGPSDVVRSVLFVGVETTEEVESRRRIEALAAEARRRTDELNGLLESLSEGVIIAGPDGEIVLLNEAGRRVWGEHPSERAWTIEEYRTLDLRSLEGAPLGFSAWPISRALSGERFVDHEVHYVRRDGARRQLSFSGSQITDEAGRVLLAINVFRDVTELRELERMKDEYVSLISHDLRAPLSVMLGHADLLRRKLSRRSDEAPYRSAEAIFGSGQRLNAMIQDLVDSARLESGRLALSPTPLSLPALVADTIRRTVGPVAAGRVQLRIEDGDLDVLADAERLSRVVTNLVANALKYSSADRPVVVTVARRGDEARCAVQDWGVGIEPDKLPRVFERFFRAQPDSKVEGLGLGLYIAKLIVDAHGGRVWVESEAGSGSTFGFDLPLLDPGHLGPDTPGPS